MDGKKILAAIRVRWARIDSCTGHEFEPSGDRRFMWYCHNCGENHDAHFVSAYRQGLKHGEAGHRLVERMKPRGFVKPDEHADRNDEVNDQ